MKRGLTKKFLTGGLVSALMVLGSACGMGPNGNYVLTENFIGGYLSSSCTSSQLTLTFVNSGGTVSGSGTNTCFSENLQGTLNGSQITVTNLSVIMLSSGGYGGSSSCTYSGTLMNVNNQISGMLNASNTTSSSSTSYYSSYCPTTVTISGTMSN